MEHNVLKLWITMLYTWNLHNIVNQIYLDKKKTKLLLTILEAGSLRSGCQHGQVRALFQVSDFLCPHIVKGGREFCGVSFIRALISFTRAPPSWPNHLPKVPPPNTLWGLGFQHMNLGGHEHSDHSNCLDYLMNKLDLHWVDQRECIKGCCLMKWHHQHWA